MATIQSSIELADRAQRRIFVASIVFGVIAALIAALLAWLVWNANNKYQETVKADADARIATADSRAAEANAQAAKANEGLGKSNAEIARLTNEAEQAKTERAEADKQIAIAKADAARAKEGIANAEARSMEASAEVARLRVVVANAEKERAVAQKALLEMQEQIKDRHLTTEQRAALLTLLRQGPKGHFSVNVASNREAQTFADEVSAVLIEAGWTRDKRESMIGPASAGFGVAVARNDIPRGVHLYNSLRQIGLVTLGDVWPKAKPDTVILFVGEKSVSK